MLICVTPNPALDRTLIVPHFNLHDVSRATQVITAAGGKGLNVARVVKLLGGEVRCVAPIGGHIGRLFAQLARAEGLPGDWTWTQAETRLAMIVAEADGNDASVVNEPGPRITPDEWRDFSARVLSNLRQTNAITFSGSVVLGPSPDDYAALLSQCVVTGKDVWADVSGDYLRAAASVPNINIKVNAQEASGLSDLLPLGHSGLEERRGEGVRSLDQAVSLAHHLLHTHRPRRVVITVGGVGAVLASSTGIRLAEAPRVKIASTVGSGDAFLAAMALAIERGTSADEALRQAVAAGTANAMTVGAGRFEVKNYNTILGEVNAYQFKSPVA